MALWFLLLYIMFDIFPYQPQSHGFIILGLFTVCVACVCVYLYVYYLPLLSLTGIMTWTGGWSHMRLSSQDTHTAMLNTRHCAARTYTCDLNTSYSVSMPAMTDVCICVQLCVHLHSSSFTLDTQSFYRQRCRVTYIMKTVTMWS